MATELADELVGHGPVSEEMRDVALQLADAILHLHAIRAERQALLSRLPPELVIDPCEEILVKNSLVSTFINALKIGTESVGDFRNIAFRD